MKKNTRSLKINIGTIEIETKSILDGCIEGVVSINTKGIIIYFNSAAEKISGFNAKEVIGKNVKILTPPKIRKNHDGYIKNYLKTGRRKVIRTGREVQLLRKDKSTLDVLLTISESGVGKGKIFTGFLKNISKEKAIRLALEEKTIELSAISNGIIDGFLINRFKNPKNFKDIQFETLTINKATSDITGYSIEELNVLESFKLFEETSLDSFQVQLKLLKIGKESSAKVLQFKTKKGVNKWIEIRSQLIDYQGGKAFIFFLRDVTESTNSEREKERVLQELNQAQKIGKNASWSWDITSGEVNFSENYFQIWGVPIQPASYDLFINGVHPDDLSKVKKALDMALKNEKKYDLSFRVVGSDGRVKVIEAIGVVNFNTNKKPILMHGSVRDITDIYAVEKKEETLAALIENSRDFIAYATIDKKVAFINESGRKMVGLAPDEDIKNYKISDFLSKKSSISLKKIELPAIKKHGAWKGESELKNIKTGEVISVTKSTFLITNQGKQEMLGFGTIQRDISERKLTEEHLLNKERIIEDQLIELEHYYNSVPVGICLVDLNLKYVRINEILAKMNGKTVEEHIGKSIEEILSPKAAKVAIEIHSKIIETKQPVLNIKFKNVSSYKKPNIKINIQASYFPYVDSNGEVKGVTGIVQDVTELVKIEDELIESKSQIKEQLIELEHNYKSLPVGVALFDVNYKWVRINDILAEINGKTIAEHIGISIEELLPDIAPNVIPVFEQVLKTGKPVLNVEVHGVTQKNPKVAHDWLVNYHPYYSSKGKITGVTTSVLEITELKKIQKALAESEERYRGIFENSADTIYTINKKGNVIDLNHHLIGGSVKETIGSNIIDLIQSKQDKKTKKDAIRRVFKGEDSVNFKTSYLHKNKKSYFSTTLSPIIIDGKVNKAIAIARNITSQKEAQLEVEKLVSIIQSSNDFIGIAGLDGKAQLLNNAGKKMVGIGSDEILKSSYMLDFFNEEGKLRMEKDILPHVQKKGYWKGEVEFQHFKTKKLIPVYFNLFRIDNQSTKKSTHFGTITRDLTETEKTRLRIAKSEKDLNEAQKIGKVGSWELDSVNKKLHWSEEIYHLLGLEINSIVPTYEIYLSFVHPQDLNMVNKAFYNHIHNQVEYNITHRIKTHTGAIKYVQQRCESEWDENNIATRSLGTTSDITEQKLIELELEKYKTHLEELVEERTNALEFANLELKLSSSELKKTYLQLTKNEARYRFLAENSYDVVIAYDADLKRTYVSPSIKRLTGFTVSETFKMSLTDCLYPSDALYLDELYNSASLKRVKDRIVRSRRLTKNNGYIWIESAISFVYARKNKLESIIISMRDISNQIKAENKLKETQDKLVESNKMASLGLLTAGVAHEINNPVNFVSAGINSLEENLIRISKILKAYQLITSNNVVTSLREINKLKSELKYNKLLKYINQSIKNVKNGADRTTEIIKGLQSFSRSESKQMKAFNVRDCIDNALLLLRNHHKDRIKIVKNYGNPVQFSGHPEKLNQVFLNILINSIQAIKEEGTITINLSKTKKSSIRFLKICITDTGEGMSDNVKSKIFDPFYTSKEVGVGTGLGLSISHGIIMDHNGIIEVESEVGKGTSFCIYLPI
jgi:PAS domain S-box-containing protein